MAGAADAARQSKENSSENAEGSAGSTEKYKEDRGRGLMDSERLRVYLSSLEQTPSPLIQEIEAHAAANFVPIIRRETAAFLKTLVAMKQPKEILEVGTATGYSALRMCEALRKDGKITTIEKYEKRIPIARKTFNGPERKTGLRY